MNPAESKGLLALEKRMAGQLDRLKNKNRYRKFSGAKGIDLSSNDYLGLSDHPAIRDRLTEALRQGIALGSTGSRLLRGHTNWHEKLERRLTAFKGSEATLIFNSGYEANVGLISTLCQAGDTVFSDALIHASLIDGIRASKANRRIFPHNDTDALADLLEQAPDQGERFVIVESLYSMDGDLAPLEKICELTQRHGAHLIVDEAHATGVFGPKGGGQLAQLELNHVPLATVHTCGKAWAGFGAFISCSQLLKNYLTNNCRQLIFTTALPPLLLCQWEAVLDIIQAESWRRTRVLSLAEQFRKSMSGIAAMGQSESQIVPIILGEDQRAVQMAGFLAEHGFDIRAIRPPTVPRGSARLRIAFNANLQDEELTRLISACKLYFQEGSNHDAH